MSCSEILLKINGKSDNETENDIEPENENIPLIQFTTYNGCKGLSAGNVFIVGLEQNVFPKHSQPTDNELCQFLVALTRTRQQCHLITVKRFGNRSDLRPSSSFQWLPNSIIKKIDVNKNFFNG